MAKDAGLDLVVVAPNAVPPVCRIIDFGKYKYTTQKQNREKKSKQQDVKGIKISPRIAEHDIQTVVKKVTGFLDDGHKVKVTCQFRAREVSHQENGMKRMESIIERLKDVSVVDRPPVMEGRLMTMVIGPKPGRVVKKDVKAKNTQDGGEEVQGNGVGEDHAPEERQ